MFTPCVDEIHNVLKRAEALWQWSSNRPPQGQDVSVGSTLQLLEKRDEWGRHGQDILQEHLSGNLNHGNVNRTPIFQTHFRVPCDHGFGVSFTQLGGLPTLYLLSWPRLPWSEVSSGGAHHPKLLSIVWGLGDFWVRRWSNRLWPRRGPLWKSLAEDLCRQASGFFHHWTEFLVVSFWTQKCGPHGFLRNGYCIHCRHGLFQREINLRRFWIAFWPTLWSRLDRQSLGGCSAFTPSSGIQEPQPLSRFGSGGDHGLCQSEH